MTRAFVVLNPVSGGKSGAAGRAIARHFEQAGWTHEIYETTGLERVDSVVRTALGSDGADLVVAVGGDGTVSGVASGLVHTDVPMGIVPVGTANTLARELGIPLRTKPALALLTGDHVLFMVDVIEVSGRFFIMNVSVGLSSLMMRDTDRLDKRRFGRVAYVWTGLRKLFGYQPHRFALTVDGESEEVTASEVAIVNIGALGDPTLRWSTEVALNDGQIDVLVIRARSALDYLSVAASVVLRRQAEDPAIRHRVAQRSVRVDAESDLPVQADGDFIGPPPVEVGIVPDGLRVVVPRKRGGGAVEWVRGLGVGG
jgi:YegS/Rv2252/BmrU family lipid kinase